MASRYLIGETAAPAGSVALPESFNKKAARNAANLKLKVAAIAENVKKAKVTRHAQKTRAQQYEKEYKLAAKREVNLRRAAKKAGNFYVESQPKLLFIIRSTGINKMAPKPRKILKLLRLDQLHKGVFVHATKPMMNMLKYIQPYTISGYPSLKSTRELIMKRGCAKVGNERVKLNSNDIIAAALEKKTGGKITGVEDLIHEIYTCGPHFKQCNNFLWAFKLSSPNGGLGKKKHGFHEPKGGEWGNREEMINALLKRMM